MKLYNPNYPVDLHCHTTRSDGADTPKELIDFASQIGMEVVAITDHDVRPPQTIFCDGLECEMEDYAAGKGITVLKGIEISCETLVEDCHLVCLGCDWDAPYFDKLEKMVAESKVAAYRLLIEKLCDAGYHVSWEEVLDNSGQPVLETQVQKKMIFELLYRKGYFKSWSDAKKMVKNTAEFTIPRLKPDPLEVIREIHHCGGVVIMAHPYLVNERVKLYDMELERREYIERLLDGGLDGIEASYTYGKTSYTGGMTQTEIEKEVRLQYTSKVRILSGGSDYHADSKKGVQNPRMVGECGLSKREFYENPILAKLAERVKGVIHI